MAQKWYPVIDYVSCIECGTCSAKCPHGVYDSAKEAVIEYLYLDLKICDRCIGTENILDEVLAILTPTLELAGYSVAYRKMEMVTAEPAEQNRFLSSPTIRVNGVDVCESVQENNCGCCGKISGTQVDCRVFAYQGKTYEIPPAAMLAESILKALFAGNADRPCAEYEMPQNLKEFYQGKKAKESRAGGCCRE